MSFVLRPYQEEAVSSVLRAWETHHATLVVAPTGTGKTVTFCELAMRRRPFGRVLVLAHREELIDQAKKKLEQSGLGKVSVEMAEQHAFSPLMSDDERPDAVVASVSTLANAARLAAFPCEEFATVIVDEAQHAVAATWKSVLRRFEHAKIAGFTATPDRADRKGLREVFDHVAFEMDLRTAIEEKYLVPILQRRIDVESLDLSSVKSNADDLDERELERVLLEERALHEMAVPIAELAGTRPTLVFAASVKHALALENVLRRYIGAALVKTVHGQLPRDMRRDLLDRFQRGELQFVINCALLTEGFDAPHTACIAMCRPTKSRPLYAQIVGRGTRPAPGKQDCLVLDFRGNAGKHQLVSVIDLLGRDMSAEARSQAEALVDAGDGDVMQAILEQEEQAAREAARRIVSAGSTPQDSAESSASQVTVGAVYTQEEVDLNGATLRAGAVSPGWAPRKASVPASADPFVLLGIERSPILAGWRSEPRSAKQADVLARNGIDSEGMYRGDASDLITAISNRAAKGLCTPKQAKFLARKGRATNVSFEEASRQIDELMSYGRRAG